MKHNYKQLLAQIAKRFTACADDQGAITRLAEEVKRGHVGDLIVKHLCDRMVTGGIGQNVHATAAEYQADCDKPEPVVVVAPVVEAPKKDAPLSPMIKVTPDPVHEPTPVVEHTPSFTSSPHDAESEPAKDEVEEHKPVHGKRHK